MQAHHRPPIGRRIVTYRNAIPRVVGVLCLGARAHTIMERIDHSKIGPVFVEDEEASQQSWSAADIIVAVHCRGDRFCPPANLAECRAQITLIVVETPTDPQSDGATESAALRRLSGLVATTTDCSFVYELLDTLSS